MRKWKEVMEKKGLRGNVGWTKVMWCSVSRGPAEDSGEHPCGVCREEVGDNSILCVEYGGGNSTSAEEVLQIPASLP